MSEPYWKHSTRKGDEFCIAFKAPGWKWMDDQQIIPEPTAEGVRQKMIAWLKTVRGPFTWRVRKL